MKKIAYLTGSRADFGRATYFLKEIEKDPDLELHIIATGMHFLDSYGKTINEVEKEFNISKKIEIYPKNDSNEEMAKVFGEMVSEFSRIFNEIKPDTLIVLGDRGEMLAGAISAQHMNIPVIHIGGGHRSGSIDDRIRDSISIFSNYHLVASEKTSYEVAKLGIKNENIHIVGAPDLEVIDKKDFSGSDEIINKYSIDISKPLVIFSLHSNTTEVNDTPNQIKTVCEALLEVNLPTIVIYPNSDAGGKIIIEAIDNVLSKNSNFKIYDNIPYKDFLGLMSISSLMIGNSSAGIIEAPSFGLPVINIGSRQKNRERSINVTDVDFDKIAIINSIKDSLHDKEFIQKAKNCKNPYYKKDTSKSILRLTKESLK
ncbi:UDP-N-acetylglucosamine 2-epimerase [Nanoarchaeota archaeon]